MTKKWNFVLVYNDSLFAGRRMILKCSIRALDDQTIKAQRSKQNKDQKSELEARSKDKRRKQKILKRHFSTRD